MLIKSAKAFVVSLLLVTGLMVNAQSRRPLSTTEHFAYSMHFGWFQIGTADVWVEPISDDQGKNDVLIQCHLVTTGIFKFLAQLDACIETRMSAKHKKPIYSSWVVSFGKDKDLREEWYQLTDSMSVSSYDGIKNRYSSHTYSVENDTIRDVLSTFLQLRGLAGAEKIQSDTTIANVFFFGKSYPFGLVDQKVKPSKKKRNRLEFVFPPTDTFSKKADNFIELSNTDWPMPLKFQVSLKYGDFAFQLKDYEAY